MDKEFHQAEDTLQYLSADKKIRRVYELREKFLRDEASRMNGAKEEGEREGKKEGKKEMIKELHKEGVAISIIARSSGFTEEEVNKIIQKEE